MTALWTLAEAYRLARRNAWATDLVRRSALEQIARTEDTTYRLWQDREIRRMESARVIADHCTDRQRVDADTLATAWREVAV